MMERSKTQYLDSTAQLSSAGLIIRQKEPRNLESPFDQIESYLTPTELFYIRSHFPIPGLDRATYQLRIDGAVRHPFALSYEELRSMRSETRVATLECAGNSRVFLVPQVQGAQWELGAVSNAEWTGVPLRALLECAELEEDACEIVLEGADRGTPKEEPVPPDPISYAWSLPRAKAIQPEVLIAYQMNGRDLSPDHGFPVRRNCARTLWNGFGQVADGYPSRTQAVSRLLADIGLCLLGFDGWKAGAAPVGRNAAQVRNRATACLRDASPEPYLHRFRRCMGGRDRRD